MLLPFLFPLLTLCHVQAWMMKERGLRLGRVWFNGGRVEDEGGAL